MRILTQSRSVRAVAVPYRARGFTLVELLVTIAVAAVLMMFAIPSFTNMINNNRLNAAANAMIGALNTARMAAIQQNTSAQFCSNAAATNTTTDALGTKCDTNAGEVFVFAATSSSATGSATQLAAPPAELNIPSIHIHGTIAAIRYNSQGIGYAPGATTPFDSSADGAVVDLCSTALSTNNDIQIRMATGSIISTVTTTGTCP